MVWGGGKQGGVDGRESVGVDGRECVGEDGRESVGVNGWGWWEGGKHGRSMESYWFSPHCSVFLPESSLC